MERLCERPGCSQVAEFLYAIDAEHLTVWLEPFESVGGERAGVLCRRHADAMIVPLGWMLDDRRAHAPQLFRTLSAPSVTVSADRSRRQRAGTPAALEAQQLSLDEAQDPEQLEGLADVVGPTPGEPAPGADAADRVASDDADPTVLPWRPVFDQADDLDGLLAVSSPLLRRAFGRNPPPLG